MHGLQVMKTHLKWRLQRQMLPEDEEMLLAAFGGLRRGSNSLLQASRAHAMLLCEGHDASSVRMYYELYVQHAAQSRASTLHNSLLGLG